MTGLVQHPSVGRIVHYVSHGTPPRADGTQAFRSECRAAVVTEVDPDDSGRVGLAVLNPTGQFFHSLAAGGCRHHGGDPDHVDATPGRPTYVGGTWHWPERA